MHIGLSVGLSFSLFKAYTLYRVFLVCSDRQEGSLDHHLRQQQQQVVAEAAKGSSIIPHYNMAMAAAAATAVV